MLRVGRLLVAVLQLGVAVAYADPLHEDRGWLRTMAFAAHQTSYSGIFVYQAGGRVEMSRVAHVSDDQGEFEYLENLGGGNRVVIRNNDQLWISDGHKVRAEKRPLRQSFPALLPEQLSALKENYVVRQAEEAEVAGFHAHAVLFQPRDQLRFARKMWAHSDSGLVLKAAVLDDRGFIMEQYAFMQLQIGDIDRKKIMRERIAVEMLARPASAEGQAEPIQEDSGWQVDALPRGFKKIAELRRPIRENRSPVIQIVFSDGLAGISVFIEKVSEVKNISSGLSGLGAAHVYNRIVGDWLVTVVGEVPARAVIQVADSVRYAGS